jgi:hypothetical protein
MLYWHLTMVFLCVLLLLQVGQWTSQCLEGFMQRLSALNKPYKYVVTCIIMQKTGKGTGSRTNSAAIADTSEGAGSRSCWRHSSGGKLACAAVGESVQLSVDKTASSRLARQWLQYHSEPSDSACTSSNTCASHIMRQTPCSNAPAARLAQWCMQNGGSSPECVK